MTHPAARVLPFLRPVAWLLFAIFAAPMSARHRRNVPKSGALLVISNHMSNTDPVAVQWACPRHLRFLARRELFNMGLLGKFVMFWGAEPISQATADKGALKKAIELLKEGNAVGIFPEGGLSPDGRLIDLKPGTALIVRRSGAPCVCVGLRGTNKLMPDPTTQLRWAFHRIEANWGEPRQFRADCTEEEVMDWARAELLRLSGQSA